MCTLCTFHKHMYTDSYKQWWPKTLSCRPTLHVKDPTKCIPHYYQEFTLMCSRGNNLIDNYISVRGAVRGRKAMTILRALD